MKEIILHGFNRILKAALIGKRVIVTPYLGAFLNDNGTHRIEDARIEFHEKSVYEEDNFYSIDSYHIIVKVVTLKGNRRREVVINIIS